MSLTECHCVFRASLFLASPMYLVTLRPHPLFLIWKAALLKGQLPALVLVFEGI